MSKKNKSQQKTQKEPQPQTSTPPVEEYAPSQNAEKYPKKEEPEGTFKYKVLTYRNDHVRLQEEITQHLNDGWELVGGVSTAFHADSYSTLNMFSQAIVKRF
jgi:hypothetical protein